VLAAPGAAIAREENEEGGGGFSLPGFLGSDPVGAGGAFAHAALAIHAMDQVDAQHHTPGADGALWAPYLMGERAPHMDPNIRAGLVGLAANHTRAHVIRAVLEGVAFSLRDSLTIFSELGVPVKKIRLGGGGARSPLWRQIQADVYDRDVEILAAEEGAAFGAAILAGVGAGIWPGVDEACDQAIRASESIACQPHIAKLMNERYSDYQRLYPALRSLHSTYKMTQDTFNA